MQITDYIPDRTVAIRDLAGVAIKIGSVEKPSYKNNYGGTEKSSIELHYCALYFPDLGLLTATWSISSGFSDEYRQARSEFIPWEGGLPVYRRVEELRQEALRWAREGGLPIKEDGKLDLWPFTWADPYPV